MDWRTVCIHYLLSHGECFYGVLRQVIRQLEMRLTPGERNTEHREESVSRTLMRDAAAARGIAIQIYHAGRAGPTVLDDTVSGAH